MKPKSFDIPKALVWEAYEHVKANGGAAGVDHETIEKFEERWGDKLSNRFQPRPLFAPNNAPHALRESGVRIVRRSG